MRPWFNLAAAAVLAMLSACAPKTVAPPVVSAPRFPDFVRPGVPAQLAGSPAMASHDRAWQFLQAGDLRGADREVAVALKASPNFYPTHTTAGYVGLARKDYRGALAMFDRALSRRADYAPALVGKGQVLAALNRDSEAIEAFRAALAADLSLSDVQRRLEVLTFRSVQRDVGAARQAVRSGKFEEAKRAYRTAIEGSPDSAFLYRELATLERDHGDGDSAVAYYRRAVSLDPSDAASLVDLAEMLDARNEFDAALKAYADALALGPDPAVAVKRDALRARAEIARLPPEYRATESAAQISRGDLAALIGLRLGSLLQVTRAQDLGVITDIRTHWAERWILAVARAGVMDAYDNHTFQPRSLIRRVDFAQTVARLLAKVAAIAPTRAGQWRNARGRFPDLTPSHLAYPAASVAVAAGVMTTAEDGSFQPSRLVTGAEATSAIEQIRIMASLTPAASRP
jgi:tetratricopeptide (TPR) repeat protein